MAEKFVQMIEGNLASLFTDSIEEAQARLGLIPNGIETRTNLRPCLQGQPKFAGVIGPCYGGTVNGVDVIRYEDAAAYRKFSQ